MKRIFCVECDTTRSAVLVSGRDIYPNRYDLYELPFYRCEVCKNYVGCHHNSKRAKLEPLGVIPNRELRQKRQEVHAVLDPIWKNKIATRKIVYQYLSNKIGREYHTAEIRTVNQAERVIRFLKEKFLIGNK